MTNMNPGLLPGLDTLTPRRTRPHTWIRRVFLALCVLLAAAGVAALAAGALIVAFAIVLPMLVLSAIIAFNRIG